MEDNIQELKYPTDYIPSLDDLDEMKKDIDQYVPFLLWINAHHPEPLSLEDHDALKEIREIVYGYYDIVDDPVPVEKYPLGK